VYERLDSESPQQKPLDGEALALIANLSQRNPRIENRGGRKRLPKRRLPGVSLEIPKVPSGCCFLPLSLKFSTVGVLPPINSRDPPPLQPRLRFQPHFFIAAFCLLFPPLPPANRFSGSPSQIARLVLLLLCTRVFVFRFPALHA
jgi:hypothetical protein